MNFTTITTIVAENRVRRAKRVLNVAVIEVYRSGYVRHIRSVCDREDFLFHHNLALLLSLEYPSYTLRLLKQPDQPEKCSDNEPLNSKRIYTI